MKDLKVKNEGPLCSISLNRPEAHNAISSDMVNSIVDALQNADKNVATKVVLLNAQGPTFCAGGDIKDMLEKKGMFKGETPELRMNYKCGIQRIPLAIENFSKPIIAVIDGPAIGAGCDLACMADLRIGSEKAEFCETFAKLALVPGDGGTYFLSRLIGHPRAMEMLLTNRTVKGEEALQWGLLNRLVKSNELKATAHKLALQIATLPGLAVQFTKEALKRSRHNQLPEHLDLLATYQSITQRTPEHFEALKNLARKTKEIIKTD